MDNITTLVLDSKFFAKWYDDKARRQKVQEWIDFYNNDHRDYILAEINKIFTGEQEKSEMRKRIEMIDLTQTIIKEISLIFDEPCLITLDTENEKQQEIFNNLLQQVNIQSILSDVNKMTNLCSDWGVMPIWDTDIKQMRFLFISPSDCFVIQKSDDPTQIEGLFYSINPYQNSPLKIEKTGRYVYWNSEGQWIGDIDMMTGRIQNVFVLQEVNIFDGEIPVTFFRNYIPQKTFWKEGENYLVHKNKVIDLKLTGFSLGEDMSVPTLVTRGYPEDDTHTGIKGWTAWINFEIGENTEAGYIFYEIKKEFWEYIEKRIIQVANSYDIFPDKIKKANSGYQVKLIKQPLLKANIRQRPFYTHAIKRLLKHTIILWNANNPTQTISSDIDISINYGEMQFEVTPNEKNKNYMERKSLGLESRIDQIMREDPDLSHEDAIEKAKRIDEENKIYTNTAEIEKEIEEVLS